MLASAAGERALLTRGATGSSPLAVCFFGDYALGHPREVVLKRGLEKNHGTVFGCNIDLKRTEPRYLRMRAKPAYLGGRLSRVLKKFRRAGERFSHVVIPHNNHLIVPLPRRHGCVTKFGRSASPGDATHECELRGISAG